MIQNTGEPFRVCSKIWFEDSSGKVVFGLGRLKMLEAIQRYGSIQAAAKELKMSYRAVWGRITATEDRIGKQLLIRNVGGASGGGSELTPYAIELLKKFKDIHKEVADEADRLFQEETLDYLMPDRKAERGY